MPDHRSTPDACPGALHVHEAADGALSRIRLPGGHLAPSRLQALVEAAEHLGNGEIELTSRGNVQLRSVRDPQELAQRLATAGLLPSATHERVRNVLGSPLSGRLGGRHDIRDLVHDLDRRLIADPALAELPGRVLFTVDDGRGDVSPFGGDFGIHAIGDDRFALVLAGADTGVRLDAADTVTALLDSARAFLDLRERHWRLAELDDGARRTLEHLGVEPEIPPAGRVTGDADARPPVGWFAQHDGRVALGATVALGVLPARTARFLAAVERPVIVTPWRSILLVDLDEWVGEQVVRVLAPMGLIFDANSPWAQVSACAGSPGCAKSLADVRSDVRAAVEEDMLPVEGRQHWSGCERRCGSPGHGERTDVVATGHGYRVDTPSR